MVIFDLRQERRDVTVALTMIREIFPRMATGGVVVIGAADPADRESLRQEREQLIASSWPSTCRATRPRTSCWNAWTPLAAEEYQRQESPAPASRETSDHPLPDVAPPARPAPVRHAAPPPAPGEPVPCLVKVLSAGPTSRPTCCWSWRTWGAEALVVDDSRNVASLGALPDFLHRWTAAVPSSTPAS